MAALLHRLGRWCVEHRGRVVLCWLAVLVGLTALAGRFGGEPSDDFRVPDVESQRAVDLLRDRFPEAAGGSAQVVLHRDDGGLLAGRSGRAVDGAVDRIRDLPGVLAVTDPVPSADGTTALVQVQYEKVFTDFTRGDLDALVAVGGEIEDPAIELEVGGELPQYVEQPETGMAEVIGIAAAVVILLFAFGSVIAMGLPIGVALVGLGVSAALTLLAANVIDIPKTAPILATMIGIGVGIDYALFVVTRHREHLQQGMTVAEAAGRAIATAGLAVMIAGGTVVIAILGLAISGIPMVTVMGFGAAVVVSIMVTATITLLPALLGYIGHRIDKVRLFRSRPGHDRAARTTVWARWGRAVARRPWPYLVAGLTLLAVLASPVLSIRFGQTDAGAASRDSTQRKAYDLVSEAFGPGANGPLLLAVESGDESVLREIADRVAGEPGVMLVAPAQVSPDGDAAIIPVVPETAPQAEATSDLIHRLRDDVLPQVDATVHVGGLTATFVDLSEKVASRLPWFIGAVVALSFVLLTIVFRSILVPLKAALMNLLSIGAAYGVIVAIFQWGWLKGLFGLDEVVPIVAFVPMMMFAILFGLSMDYEVFLLSRVREEYLVSHDNTESVISGISSTARVITSAALIMIAVFLGFVVGDDPIIKMVGVGLATAIFVDATVVRIVLVPATMALLGDANWWLPAWLDRILPHVDVEGGHRLPPPEYERDRRRPAEGDLEPELVGAR